MLGGEGVTEAEPSVTASSGLWDPLCLEIPRLSPKDSLIFKLLSNRLLQFYEFAKYDGISSINHLRHLEHPGRFIRLCANES